MSFAFVYLDDILVASKDPSEHKHHLRNLFSLLSMHGISINRKKCVFRASQVKYLGHYVSSQGISPMPERVQALQDFLPPSSKLALQHYLGMLNYYRCFVPQLARKLAPLNAALAGGPKKDNNWTEDCQAAFVDSKEALARATLLSHPSPSAATTLSVDASNMAVGAELAQLSATGKSQPLAFFSKALSTPRRNTWLSTENC